MSEAAFGVNSRPFCLGLCSGLALKVFRPPAVGCRCRLNSPSCSNPANPFCRADMRRQVLSRSPPTTSGHPQTGIEANIAVQPHTARIFVAPSEAMHSERRREREKEILDIFQQDDFAGGISPSHHENLLIENIFTSFHPQSGIARDAFLRSDGLWD